MAADGIEIRNYKDTAKFLSNISDASVLLDPAKVSIFHEQVIAKDIQVVYDINPSTLLNPVNMKAKLLISVTPWLKMESRFATFSTG